MNLSLAENRPLRLAALCILYTSQGLPDGFVRTGLKTHLIAQGATTAEVGQLIALVSWPWAIKWIWGPLIDRFKNSPMGRRRPWIIFAQFIMGLALAGILFIPQVDTNIRLLGVAVLLINCFSSLQDVAIDAMAIDLLPEEERGVANGMMFGSSYFGSFLGGAIVGGCLLKYGMRSAILLEILLLCLIAAVPILLRERRGDSLFPWTRRRSDAETAKHPTTSFGVVLGQLRDAFARRSAILAAALAVMSLITTSAHLVFWPVYLQRQLGWSSDSYLRLEGGYAIACGLVGSVVGGFIASWLGAKRSVIISLILLTCCWFAYAATSHWWSDARLVTAIFLVVTSLAGFFQVAMFALFMGVCWKPVAATQFSAYMAMLNISSGLGSVFAGYVTPETPLTRVFAILGGLQLAMVAPVWLMPELDGKSGDATSDPPTILVT